MTSTTDAVTLPAVPMDVLDFALKRNASGLIPPVAEAARQAFPGSSSRLFLEPDPELADDWRIVVEVDASKLATDEMLPAYERWRDAVLEACPASEIVGVFVLRMRRWE
jgi:hypothetical protein